MATTKVKPRVLKAQPFTVCGVAVPDGFASFGAEPQEPLDICVVEATSSTEAIRAYHRDLHPEHYAGYCTIGEDIHISSDLKWEYATDYEGNRTLYTRGRIHYGVTCN